MPVTEKYVYCVWSCAIKSELEKPKDGEATGCTLCKHCGCMLIGASLSVTCVYVRYVRPAVRPYTKNLNWRNGYNFTHMVLLASPNDIHYIEKLRNGFWSVSGILNATSLYVPCKNSHSRSKSRQIALQRISNWTAFIHLFNSAGKNIPFKKILLVFSCFSRVLQILLDF